MRAAGDQNQDGTGRPRPISRRKVLKRAALTTTLTAVGLGAARPAHAAEQGALTTTARMAGTSLTLTLRDGTLHWSAHRNGKTVIDTSALGLRLADGTVLGTDVTLTGTHRGTVHRTWKPVYGRNARVTDHYQEHRWNLRDNATGIRFGVRIRAYRTGVALRYVLLDQDNATTATATATATIADELTTFTFPTGTTVYSARDENAYELVAPHAIPVTGTSTTDNGPLTDLPLTATLADGLIACVCESSRVNFPRLMLSSVEGQPNTLSAFLMEHTARGTGPVETSTTVTTPFATPWRAVVIGSTHAELVDNAELVLNLAPESVLDDTSWIKPGKVFRCELSTAAGLAGVDFAVERGLQYIEYDAGWYGPEFTTLDATTPIAAIDMPSVMSYAASKGIGVFLYVNRLALTDADALFALYKGWGAAGIKLGFINDGTRSMTDQIIEWAATAARHRLLIDMHDDVRPFGFERTYPNYISLEGVRGNEQFPTATHNVTLPFVRNIGGPMDYTICYGQSRDKTTNAHQMAMAAVYYQPLNFLFWYDKPSKYANTANWPGLPWFNAVPVTWDESRTLAGAIGEYIAVARRSGDTWYLGAMTNETARTLSIPLDFLDGDGSTAYTATVYADGEPGSSPFRTPVVVSTATVRSDTTLDVVMAGAGGQAVVLTPSG
ncbi:glycoside hydrolase family protein [Streptomyces lincolnensis]|uniref:Glycoside hydrolase family protein n=1 Tax=Streptomyces lincolnensis TaxID=1915 RepID=A0A1B1MDL7_STRLN|nr:glycoside hydrolase family 97 protein [Streptomyces lincolnensis]ANS66664.1 glycoside hydrolase family protein [Streptomyces lincolnensis]AXG55535.1 glycoside hydrolase family protein [Streptomyces lincolnensis]QMV07968.1 glycoside hydrolase family 97 [Streptomyces lincolnensis]